VIEAIHSPTEEHCASATCAERPLATEPWSPDAPEHDYGMMNQPTVELMVETGVATTAPFDWSDAVNSLPLGHRYRRSAATQFDDGAWIHAAIQAALPPRGWEDAANSLPPGHRYPWRSAAAISQPDDGWMGPLTLRQPVGMSQLQARQFVE